MRNMHITLCVANCDCAIGCVVALSDGARHAGLTKIITNAKYHIVYSVV